MKRLLCIVGKMDCGGAETFLMKIYRELDKTKYQMDFCVSAQGKGFYDNEIISMGGKIIHTVAKSHNLCKYLKSTYRIIRDNGYKYVLRTSQNSLSAMELAIAKFAGAKVLVFRSSNSQTMKSGMENIVHKVFSFLPKIIPNVKVAPSAVAAQFMFGKQSVRRGNINILKNGIPTDRFLFNRYARTDLRNKLGIGDRFVVGHIGRFSKQKNHMFLLRIFKSILSKRKDSVLVLVGTGELFEPVKAQVRNYGIESSVVFLGTRSDVNELYSLFDVLLFPSLYEGMPNVVIEAQTSGLHCVISDTITKEANITGLVDYVSLENGAEYWATKVLQYSNGYKREDTTAKFIQNGYDIQSVTDRFVELVFQKEV